MHQIDRQEEEGQKEKVNRNMDFGLETRQKSKRNNSPHKHQYRDHNKHPYEVFGNTGTQWSWFLVESEPLYYSDNVVEVGSKTSN